MLFEGQAAEAEALASLHAAGDRVVGEFHCAECGYGVAVRRELPVCPMCGGCVWEASAWSPFSRTARP